RHGRTPPRVRRHPVAGQPRPSLRRHPGAGAGRGAGPGRDTALMATGRFEMSSLVDEAVARAGEEDFGEATWQEGLAILLDSLESDARLNDLGVEIALGGVVDYLATRLALTAWRRDHPEVADGTVERPIVIVGQPRTGTTILFDVLAQDPT